MKSCFFSLILLAFLANPLHAEKIVNVYVWGGEIPKKVIHQFEKETGIHVNFSTYDSNETMFAKLKASRKNPYDVILPSGYYVERMKKQGMLTELNHEKLPNISNLEPFFTTNEFDRGNQYSVPFIWGATGIFYNKDRVQNPPEYWGDLWDRRWKNKLLLLDDPREVFSIALLSLGYHPNDKTPAHIHKAYLKLLTLVPNIKLFASESVMAIMIDEDAIAGSAWNGDAFKANQENKQVQFVYPKDGFVIWIDCLAIPKNPPHPIEAYQFINFLLRGDIAAKVALKEGHAITNRKGKALLPKAISQNQVVYPSEEILKKGYFQRDVGDKTATLYNQYWEQLKLAF
ncbi:ABC transporter substrate-binding protein [Legionella londiniensis]|uniref:Putrescine-binding periplasmic protein n=1 Tax=Legionella londiniensis TaxID=45068 RepID=A0A0W0VQN2_9GAMM|nr:spermidine/putrescine ABC transporter substrate-binding protein [Legionella londiniensis]KTD22371.1 spermidine/putrescine-binding periplasmic protein PotD [Legionella londiniensis]STX93055.1 spermidine/putrescine transport system substrate-binding protein [Legionella londiniensis]